MKRCLWALLLFAGLARGQAPDCVQFFTFTAVGSTATADNRQVGCVGYVVVYESSGFGAISLVFQGADGATVAGTFGTFSGTVQSGANPSTNTTKNTTIITGYQGWTRMRLDSATGSGTVRGAVYGYKQGFAAGFAPVVITGACPGTVATPCVEVGPAAAGAALAGAPVLQGVSDGTNAQYAFGCTNRAAITVTAASDATIITATAAKTIRICHLDFSSDTTADLTIRQGTGTTCGTAQLALTGAYKNILGIAEDYSSLAALQTTVAARDVCLHFSTNVTAGGVVIYAVF